MLLILAVPTQTLSCLKESWCKSLQPQNWASIGSHLIKLFGQPVPLQNEIIAWPTYGSPLIPIPLQCKLLSFCPGLPVATCCTLTSGQLLVPRDGISHHHGWYWQIQAFSVALGHPSEVSRSLTDPITVLKINCFLLNAALNKTLIKL